MTGKPEDRASFKVWLDPPSSKGRIRILALLYRSLNFFPIKKEESLLLDDL